jgi:hypothetical protein
MKGICRIVGGGLTAAALLATLVTNANADTPTDIGQSVTIVSNITVDPSSVLVPPGLQVVSVEKSVPDSLVDCSHFVDKSIEPIRDSDGESTIGYNRTWTVHCWSTHPQLLSITFTLDRAPIIGQEGSTFTRTLQYTEPAPNGDPKDYSFLDAGQGTRKPIRALSCRPVKVRINPGKPADPAFEWAAKYALERVRSQTGLPLKLKGRTSFMPQQRRLGKTGQMTIAFAFPGKGGSGYSTLLDPAYSDSIPGTGGFRATNKRILTQAVVINRTAADHEIPDFRSSTMINALLQELLHTLGVGPASLDGGQIMSPAASGVVEHTYWGAGDLTALRKIKKYTKC